MDGDWANEGGTAEGRLNQIKYIYVPFPPMWPAPGSLPIPKRQGDLTGGGSSLLWLELLPVAGQFGFGSGPFN